MLESPFLCEGTQSLKQKADEKKVNDHCCNYSPVDSSVYLVLLQMVQFISVVLMLKRF